MDNFTLQVTPEDLISASNEIQRITNTIKITFGEFESYVKQTASYWNGNAADLNRSMVQAQLPEAEKIVANFFGQASKLVEIAGNYTGTRSTVFASIEELPGDVIK